MSWIGFVLAAVGIFSVVNVLDKFLMEKEITDGGVAAVINGLPNFVTLVLFSLLLGSVSFSPKIAVPGIIAGIVYTAALWTYYAGIMEEDVSRFIPTLSINTIIVTIVAFFVLGERFSIPVYAGIIAVVVGAILLSLEHPLQNLTQFQSVKGVGLAVLTAFLFAGRDLIFKLLSIDISFWTLLFWTGIGGTVAAVILSIIKHDSMRGNDMRGLKHLVISGVLTGLAYVTFAKAISVGPVSLVSATKRMQAFFVFLVSILLSIYHPDVIRESLSLSILVQKFVAIVLIIGGVITIQLF